MEHEVIMDIKLDIPREHHYGLINKWCTRYYRTEVKWNKLCGKNEALEAENKLLREMQAEVLNFLKSLPNVSDNIEIDKMELICRHDSILSRRIN